MSGGGSEDRASVRRDDKRRGFCGEFFTGAAKTFPAKEFCSRAGWRRGARRRGSVVRKVPKVLSHLLSKRRHTRRSTTIKVVGGAWWWGGGKSEWKTRRDVVFRATRLFIKRKKIIK